MIEDVKILHLRLQCECGSEIFQRVAGCVKLLEINQRNLQPPSRAHRRHRQEVAIKTPTEPFSPGHHRRTLHNSAFSICEFSETKLWERRNYTTLRLQLEKVVKRKRARRLQRCQQEVEMSKRFFWAFKNSTILWFYKTNFFSLYIFSNQWQTFPPPLMRPDCMQSCFCFLLLFFWHCELNEL